MNPDVWCIGGTDSSGGAGITADLRTAHELQVCAGTIVTCVTAQSNTSVQQVVPVTLAQLQAQFDSLWSMSVPRVIKVGLLPTQSHVEWLVQQIEAIKQCRSDTGISASYPVVVYDPVLMASNGGSLVSENCHLSTNVTTELLEVIKNKLLPVVDIITPNVPELMTLTNTCISNLASMQAALKLLMQTGVHAGVAKGGHLSSGSDSSVDICLTCENEYVLSSPWLRDDNKAQVNMRGSGCTFATALSCFLANNYLLRDAFTLAKAYINYRLSIQRSCSTGELRCLKPKDQGSHNWWQEVDYFPKVMLPQELSWSRSEHNVSRFVDGDKQGEISEFASLNTLNLGLYPIVNNLEQLRFLLRLGVKTIQYRVKNLQGRVLEQHIKQAIAIGKEFQARLFINDYWQLALRYGAFGIHLGQEDVESADVHTIATAGLALGISTHGHYELLKALRYNPSYIAIGAIFPTKTKDMTGQIQGLTNLVNLLALVTNTPIVAIGGINLSNVESVLACGVGSVAVVSAITQADDPAAALQQFAAHFSTQRQEGALSCVNKEQKTLSKSVAPSIEQVNTQHAHGAQL